MCFLFDEFSVGLFLAGKDLKSQSLITAVCLKQVDSQGRAVGGSLKMVLSGQRSSVTFAEVAKSSDPSRRASEDPLEDEACVIHESLEGPLPLACSSWTRPCLRVLGVHSGKSRIREGSAVGWDGKHGRTPLRALLSQGLGTCCPAGWCLPSRNLHG